MHADADISHNPWQVGKMLPLLQCLLLIRTRAGMHVAQATLNVTVK